MAKFIPFLIVVFCFVNCQKPFEFNEEEQYKLINENLYNDLFKKEKQKVLLNEFQLVKPEREFLEFDYEKEKKDSDEEIIIYDAKKIDKKQLLSAPIPPPQPVPNISDKKWDKTKLSNFSIINENAFKRKNEQYLFAISIPIYNPKIEIALLRIERYRIDGGWNCIPYERFFLYKRQNNEWISLSQEGALLPYLTLYDYYKSQETKETLPSK